ncbi:helix-turn-helix domain-containing protein [Hymenobacter sp. BT491]|uniref:helix-turn-helix domain-containing protein n=1 Tax=Hymenobacter sp. BT491 TaxID=2766779 RepID=UPI0016537190|nr:helix-turn-helix domain-containing protein [Hymenobacter sp. BT491]
MPTLITAGIDYPQFFDDLRAVIRHELQAYTPAGPASQPTSPPDELLSIREAAEMLGVTVQTVHQHKRLGRLRYHKLGSRSYLKRSEVLAALTPQQRTVKAGKGAARA